MHTASPDPHVYSYVLGVLKGSCTLGEVATQARLFESEMNAWIDRTENREGVIG